MTKKTIRYHIFAATTLLLLLTAAGAVAWCLKCPVMLDDWCYMRIPLTGGEDAAADFWQCRGPIIETVGDSLRACVSHYHVINGRLANMLHILFQPFDRNIEAVVCGLAIALLSISIALAARRGRHLSFAALLLSTVLMWIVFPWYDGMQSLDYKSNYLWTSVMVCAVLLWIPEIETMRRLPFAIFIALSFCTGMMHEGFTTVLLVYLAAKPFFDRHRPSRRYWMVSATVTVALAVQLCGGILNRAATQPGLFSFNAIPQALTRIGASLWPLALAFAAVIFESLAGTTREALRRHGAMLLAALAASAMPIALTLFNRVFGPMDLFCIIITVDVGTRLLEKTPRWLFIGLALTVTASYAWWLTCLVKWESRMHDEFITAMQWFDSRSRAGLPYSGIVPLDAVPTDSVPLWLLDIVNQPLEMHDNTARFGASFGAGEDYMTAMAPEYATLPLEQWPRVPGNNNLRGKWPFMCTSDSTLLYYRVTLGAPDSNMPPIDRLLSHLTGRDGNAGLIFIWWPIKQTDAEGRTLWQAHIERLPRTLRHRPVLRVDSVGRP